MKIKRIISGFAALALSAGLMFSNAIVSDAASLKSGTYEKWIDRVNLPDYALTLYDKLEEGADGDKTKDVLIDYTKAENLGNGNYGITVRTYTGTASSYDAALSAVKKEFSTASDYFAVVFAAFTRDHPEVFWLNGTSSSMYSIGTSTASNGKTTYTAKFYFVIKSSSGGMIEDGYTASSIYSAISTRDKLVDEIIDDIPSGSTVAETVTYFSDTLTAQNEYNTDPTSSSIADSCFECLAALKGSTGKSGPVCESYSKAFMVLCEAADIPCILVDGTADGGNHMWNGVKVGSKWYAMDVTWNDPVVSGKSGAKSGYENNKWTLVGTSTTINGSKFSSSHIVKNYVGNTSLCYTNQPTFSTTKYTATSTTPDKVTISSTTSAKNSITVKWGKASNATGYKVYMYDSSSKSWKVKATVSSGSTVSAKVSGLTAGTTYKFKVRAYNKVGSKTYWGSYSSIVTTATKPNNPTITKTTLSKTYIRPYWSKVSGATGYRIQLKVNGKWVTKATVSSSTTSYKITGLTKGTTYSYRIQAYRKLGTKTIYSAYTTKTAKTKS